MVRESLSEEVVLKLIGRPQETVWMNQKQPVSGRAFEAARKEPDVPFYKTEKEGPESCGVRLRNWHEHLGHTL